MIDADAFVEHFNGPGAVIEHAVHVQKNHFVHEVLYNSVVDVLLPKSRLKKTKRDKITTLLYQIRRLLTMVYIPIYSYAHMSSKDDIIRIFYIEGMIALKKSLMVNNAY